jgi:hypothetical protein
MSNQNALPIQSSVTRISLAAVVAVLVGLAAISAQAAETTNRLAGNRIAANRLSGNRIAANRLSGNRLSGNRLSGNRLSGNKLSATRLEANPDTADMLATVDGREVYSYMMSCALPSGTTIEATIPDAPDTAPPDTLYTCSHGRCGFPGSLGLAEHWIDRALDPRGQRWVTACLLSRVNLYGVSVKISLHGVAPQLSVSPSEAATYTLQEGAFYGNIFADPDQPLDWNACTGKDQASGDAGDLQLRACAEPDPNDPTHTKCGFKYAGTCGNYTRSFAQSHACLSFDIDDSDYGDCVAREEGGQGKSGRIYREVITTYVKQ